jgi:hypothetical protein
VGAEDGADGSDGLFEGPHVLVVPTLDYVRFAPIQVPPDFYHAADPEPKGRVERLVGYQAVT